MALGARAYKEYSQFLKSGEITAIPRNKYSFTVSIDTIDKTYEFIRIANVQMPSFTYRTQTVNNYNDKSIVQTGIDYTPITLTAYDTKDAKFEEFLKDYARHYVAGPMNDDDYAGWLNSPKGLEPRDTNHYIKRMIIDRVDGKHLKNKIEIFHPFIANADTDTLDYSDSSPTVFRVSFNYEGYRILSENSAPPPDIVIPVETIVPLEHVKEHVDKSGVYETTTKVDGISLLESNRAELITHGIAGTTDEEREARAASIAVDANKVDNAVFKLGHNEIVIIDGQHYMISRETHPDLFTEEYGYGN